MVPLRHALIAACRPALRRTPLALALALASSAFAQGAAPRRDADKKPPVVIEADEIRGRPDLETVAEGRVELRRGSVVLRADRLTYEQPEDTANARGHVRIDLDGDWFAGPEAQLQLQRFEGYFLKPEFYFERTGGGGAADRIDFIDAARARAINALYTSCPRDGSGDPAWLLSASRVKFDFEANEGVAEGAVLRFYGVPILGAPVVSFPLTDERKSGWLPPNVNLDNRSGFQLAVPYYWNIAPNRDATLTPGILTRRGVSLQTEFRWLEPNDEGQVVVDALPRDRVADRSRGALRFVHEGDRLDVHYRANVLRVSDDAYWKDFPHAVPTLTPRLLPLDLGAERRLPLAGDWSTYARVQRWQVLQDPDAIEAPYERSPQVGVRGSGALGLGIEYGVETELDRFTLPEPDALRVQGGTRWHLLGSLSRRWGAAGWWVTPRLALNSASYHTDEALGGRLAGRHSASRTIPTASVDAGLLFERDTRWFGRALRQTLEPRLLYVNTPFRDQTDLPNFDAAGKDFNDVSVFGTNAFSGIDRVSDAHLITAGATTRFLDAASGAELLRLGLAQRFLLRDQRITPEDVPVTRRVSDLLLLASSRLEERWSADAAVQYSSDTRRVTRSVVGGRFSPGPYRTVGAGYRFTRGTSEQLDVGWQWPVYGPAVERMPSQGCGGTLYSVGRVNYSLRDSRITDSLLGVEYDAGCWIARIVAERVSTGRSEATTRLQLQLELVGLSRLGSNPLRALKDNIPGYRLLREPRTPWSPNPPVYE